MTFWGTLFIMKPIRVLSAAEQVAAHLRDEILRGNLVGEMAGIHQRSRSCQHKTVKAALLLLEKEGLLVSQGAGRPRKIVLPEEGQPPFPLPRPALQCILRPR